MPSVDLIDLDFPEWHTAANTLEVVSAQSRRTVADVLIAALPVIEERLSAGAR